MKGKVAVKAGKAGKKAAAAGGFSQVFAKQKAAEKRKEKPAAKKAPLLAGIKIGKGAEAKRRDAEREKAGGKSAEGKKRDIKQAKREEAGEKAIEKKARAKKQEVEQRETAEKAVAKATKEEQLKASDVIYHPLITEKTVNMVDAENKLTFVVDKNATKGDVKKAIEALYGVKVEKVNIMRDMKARKRAIVKLSKGFKAEEIATRLGML